MKKEPFLQVSKRRNKARWQERLLIRFIALILALIVCGAVIVALVKMNPVDVYKAIWDGAMGSERRLWKTIRDTMVLLCISIGLAPAFKMKFWNIGAEDQILIGGACSAAVMIYAGDKMPTGLLLIVMFVATAGGRGFTAIIVAWLSKFNTFIMIAVSFGIVFMDQGAVQIATQYGLNENASDVLLGIILFFLIRAEFFINYRVKRAKK